MNMGISVQKSNPILLLQADRSRLPFDQRLELWYIIYSIHPPLVSLGEPTGLVVRGTDFACKVVGSNPGVGSKLMG